MFFSQENEITISILKAYLQQKNFLKGAQLLSLAIARADLDENYRKDLQHLFNNYSTNTGRDVFAFAGNYWKDLKHLNAVDEIDAGFCHLWNIKNDFYKGM